MNEGIKHLQDAMADRGYITDRATATAAYLAITLAKAASHRRSRRASGKTEVAKVLARVLATDLVRLQCYEGLDVATALYEWNYPKQLLHIKLGESLGSEHGASVKRRSSARRSFSSVRCFAPFAQPRASRAAH